MRGAVVRVRNIQNMGQSGLSSVVARTKLIKKYKRIDLLMFTTGDQNTKNKRWITSKRYTYSTQIIILNLLFLGVHTHV